MLKKQRGQVSVLFALLIPIFMLFFGLTLDLGWYYLNVSRLQNAADAAAIAGAQKIIDDKNNFSDYTNVALIDKYPGGTSNKYLYENSSEQELVEESDAIARDYVTKNLSKNNAKTDSWTKSSIEMTQNLYEKDDNLYYVVQLREEIRHFFLSGWFDDMTAPVTAVALLSKSAQAVTPAMPEKPITFETPVMPELNFSSGTVTQEEVRVIEKYMNQNLVVGNWEVQNYYRQNKNKTITYTDENGNKVTISEYEARFGTTVYSEAWNHFQEFYNHYTAGDFFRKETVTIKDDLVGEVIKEGYKFPTKWGEQSSVAATSASINNDKNDSAYNPGVTARKTYKEGITDTSTVGRPYIWQRLDSINIDFRPEVELSGKWLKEDWDVDLDYTTGVSFNANAKWETNEGYGYDDIKKLRIHTNINYEDPYKVREGFDEEENQDILWTRIESEPMLSHPDITDVARRLGLTSNMKNQTGLNSVHQIIVNFNKSNYDRGDEKYRPVIVFYDGPETNSIYDDYSGWVRKSQPVVVNMNVPFRAVVYMPNSPVVIMGSAQNEFRGFVVAKEYRQLMTAQDFDFSHTRYYEKGKRATTVARVYEDGTIKNADGKIINSIPSNTYSEKIYKLKGSADPTETKDYYYYIPAVENPESGIDIFVDYYGNLQTKELTTRVKRIGTYDNFGRTNFSTHNYNVLGTLADNLLLSGR